MQRKRERSVKGRRVRDEALNERNRGIGRGKGTVLMGRVDGMGWNR